MSQKCIPGFPGIFQLKLSGFRIKGINHFIHFSIHSGIRRIHQVRIQKPFSFKLSIYRHLITGIHNVIISISRTKLHGKISGIAENRAPFSPPPGSYHHHPIHSPGSIKRCRSSIFQDINTFNIIGI